MKRYWRWLLAGVLFIAACGELDENDCYPDELYDPVEDVCYIECETDAECAALEPELGEPVAGAAVVVEPTAEPQPMPAADPELKAGPEPINEPVRETDANTTSSAGSTSEELPPFAVYAVDENLNLELLEVVDDTAVDLEEYEAIWAIIRDLLPPDILVDEVYQFQVFTDGPEETLAYVEPLPDDPDRWLMAIDMADVEIVNGELSDDVVHTIVHEFAHILTLENDQVPPDPDANSAETCTTFFTGEGCALPEAYINQFYFVFWDDIFDELLEIEAIEDRIEYEDTLYEFYEKYEDRFLTDYAATNPGEDIAESFAYFVLYEEPDGTTMADEKMRFFFDYPQMVTIRDHIYGQLTGE